MTGIKCNMCGACCIAYDISTLSKPAGAPCIHLLPTGLCGSYETRPPVCRNFKPDELCLEIKNLPLEEKIARIREVYGII
jgi:Fe-S-cluster containining protein